MKTMCLFLAALFFPLPQPAVAQAVSTEPFPETLDTYIRGALRDWEIPGAAIVVVKDGRVVVVRRLGLDVVATLNNGSLRLQYGGRGRSRGSLAPGYLPPTMGNRTPRSGGACFHQV